MGVRYYVCALDISEDGITALSCPDGKTARQAYLIASQKMKIQNGTNGFYFRCIEINVTKSRIQRLYSAIRSSLHSYLVHAGISICRDISPPERDLSRLDIDEIEAAESKTKDLLHNPQHIHRRDIRFMRYVEWFLEGCPSVELEMYLESKPHVDEPKGVIIKEISSAVSEELRETILSTPSKEDIERAVYSGSLRALVDSKNPHEKYRRWAMSKHGIGHMDIAIMENPEAAKTVKSGCDDPKKVKESEKTLKKAAAKIRMQINRLNESATVAWSENSNKKTEGQLPTTGTIIVQLSDTASQSLVELSKWKVCEPPKTEEKT